MSWVPILLLSLAVSFMMGSDVLAQEDQGKNCDINKQNSCESILYVCKADSPGGSGKCVCRWGKLEIGWPLSSKTKDICALFDSSGSSSTYLSPLVDFLGEIIVIIVALVVMAGLVSIVIGGYFYMTAGGNADRVRLAKVWIGSAILGIILALLAWLILRSIATNLVQFSDIVTPSPTSSPTPT